MTLDIGNQDAVLRLDISRRIGLPEEDFIAEHKNEGVKFFQATGRHLICDGCNKIIIGEPIVPFPSDKEGKQYDDLDSGCFKQKYTSSVRDNLSDLEKEYYDRIEKLF